MTWRYHQTTGDIFHNDTFEGTGYSGAGHTLTEGRNNPAMEGIPAKGPIPHGKWRIGDPYLNAHTGPVTMNLDPVGFDPHGRSLFRIHGNNTADDASHGCIILGRGLRQEIAASGDRDLEVF